MAVAGVMGLFGLAGGLGFCGGVPSRAWHGVVYCLGGGESVFAWRAAVSRPACVVELFLGWLCGGERAVLTVRAGRWGLIPPALAKSAPPSPAHPRHHGTARCCAACGRRQKCGLPLLVGCIVLPAFTFSRVTAFRCRRTRDRRARGEPFRQSLLAVCGGRLTPERAQSEATPARISRAK